MPPRPAGAGAEGEGGGRDGRQAGGSGRGGAHRWGMAKAEGREGGEGGGRAEVGRGGRYGSSLPQKKESGKRKCEARSRTGYGLARALSSDLAHCLTLGRSPPHGGATPIVGRALAVHRCRFCDCERVRCTCRCSERSDQLVAGKADTLPAPRRAANPTTVHRRTYLSLDTSGWALLAPSWERFMSMQCSRAASCI